MNSLPPLVRRVFVGTSGLRAGWRLLTFVAMVVVLYTGGNRGVGLLFPRGDPDIMFLVREALHLGEFLFAAWVMGRIERRRIADYGLPWRRMFRRDFWLGALVGFVGLSALIFALAVGGFASFGGVALSGPDIAIWAVGWGLVFVLVALFEEFATRGYGLFVLTQGVGFWPAALITSAFFAYRHTGNSGEDWIGVANVGGFGLLLCLILRRTGDLWAPIGLHAGWDWGESFLYGVGNSGHVEPHHLLAATPAGPGWLSGRSVGPEGSVLCSALLAAMIALVAVGLRGVRYPPASAALAQAA
jgi:hypothetical protein